MIQSGAQRGGEGHQTCTCVRVYTDDDIIVYVHVGEHMCMCMCTYMCACICSGCATHESAGRQGTTFTNREKVNDDSVPSHVKGYTHTGTIMYTHADHILTCTCTFLEAGMMNKVYMYTIQHTTFKESHQRSGK